MDLKRNLICSVAFLGLLSSLGVSSLAFATTVTEEFDTSNEGWLSGAFAPLTYNASGGPDGSSYVSLSGTSFSDYDQTAAFRGHDDFDASGDAFVGNWIAYGWVTLSAWIRHDGPEAASFFTRIATADNFPAFVAINPVPVAPGVWTEVVFDVNPLSSTLIPEGPTAYPAVFGNVGNVQFGLSAPAGFENDTTPIVFDLDKVTVTVPEPVSAGLLGLGMSMILLSRKRK